MVISLTANGYTAPMPPAAAHVTCLTADLSAIRTSLDSLAVELSRLWQPTLAAGNFGDIDRFLGASQAIHLAVVALRDDTGSWRS